MAAVKNMPDAHQERTAWDDLKARYRLADVARRSGLAVPAGGRVMVCCPTPGHHDSTPSMQLDLDQDRYWCFGCNSHGDVVDWVRDIEGVDTTTAIQTLDSGRAINAVFSSHTSRPAAPVGDREPPQPDRTPAARVDAANNLAWQYYGHPTLHERGASYLAQRGIDVAALEAELAAPVVGHTPSSKARVDGLVTFLTGKGFTEDELVDAGLATRLRDGCAIDFFRDRVIIPVRDHTNTVVGLLGRDITDRSKRKYLNPPTTASYRKGLLVYRPSTPRLDHQASTVVCEGPMDALAIAAHAAAAGLSEYFAPIAACGRVLSDSQIETVLAAHPRAPVLAADGDQPGRDANVDWATRMLAKGRESVITTWPDGHDPSSWLATRGPDGLLAVTRRGCLDDRSSALRPRHCGALLTEAVFADHDEQSLPDPRSFTDAVHKATTNLSPAARQRYIAAAASVLRLPPPPPAGHAAHQPISAVTPARPTTAQPDPEIVPTERIPI